MDTTLNSDGHLQARSHNSSYCCCVSKRSAHSDHLPPAQNSVCLVIFNRGCRSRWYQPTGQMCAEAGCTVSEDGGLVCGRPGGGQLN